MKKLMLLALMALASGCSLEASLEDLDAIISAKAPSKATGLVSGSTQDGTTSSGYKIQSSVGNYLSEIEQTTDTGKYKVYSSIQGAIVSQ
ncbi:hypothetical protein B9G69_005395 [Bdellovibrio sp. SKB1291214]|uniref:hypothetical protein n=1 Tax=Bdellovibrio sp. SKB1291214 TaxID=1732569 RepID=UPI000B519A35|nr:hypothetical protein [Bdellovibrio sp. SKB1291214]UYL10010.1 hypothetical protein B9G69_005395 [Bdellovibrio sp. SKB1291214]